MAPCPLAFDVTPDEQYILSISLSSTRLRLFQQFSSDGNVVEGIDSTNYYSDSKSKLVTAPDNVGVYVSAYEKTTNKAAV